MKFFFSSFTELFHSHLFLTLPHVHFTFIVLLFVFYIQHVSIFSSAQA